MKKFIAILLVLVVSFSAFAQGSKEETAAAAPALKVGMVTDSGSIDDRSFNQGTYEGIKAAADELGLECRYLKPSGTATPEYVTAIADLADAGFGFVGCPGFLFEEAVGETADMFPELKLVILDSVVTGHDNVVSVLFKEEESGFLVGVATALKLQEGSVGFVGGIEIPPVQKYNWGFQQGIAYANDNFGTKITMDEKNFVYSGSFSDIALGQQLATTMYASGVDAIFAAAGGVGVGVINDCKNRRLAGEDVWVVGVDIDQYADGVMENGESCILTSALKGVDSASYALVKMAYDGKFPGGEILTFGAAENGVGIPAENPNLTPEIEAEVAKVFDAIAAGKIVVQATADGLYK